MTKTIKEKPVSKGAKVLTTAARAPKALVKRGVEAAKAQTDSQIEAQSPQGYAAEMLERGGAEVRERAKQGGEYVGRVVKKQMRKLVLKRFAVKKQSAYRSAGANNAVKTKVPKPSASRHAKVVKVSGGSKSPVLYNSAKSVRLQANANRAKPPSATKSINTPSASKMRTTTKLGKPLSPANTAPKTRSAIRSAAKNTIRTTSKQAAKGTIKTAAKGSVKTAKRTIKSTKTAVKVTVKGVKTARRVAVVAAKTARTAAKEAIQAARMAAKAAVVAAKTAVKVTVAVIKAIIAAMKALIAAIAAGGWVVVLVIVIIAIIAAILCSVFGVFWSNDTQDGAPMTEAIAEIQSGFQADIDKRIAELSAGGTHDDVKVIYTGGMDGDSDMVNNWADVLGIYATVVTMDKENAADVITVTPEKKQILKNIFYDMNKVTYSTETKTDTDDEQGTGRTATPAPTGKVTLNIFVEVDSMTWEDAATYYSFDEFQMQAISELMSPAYYSLFAKLLGVDIMGGITDGNMKDIISGLPPGAKGSAIVEVALTRIGHPYSQPKRGQGNYVDCSYFTWWAYKQAGVSLPSTSVEQAKYCQENGKNIGQSELQPGDLVFWSKTTCGCGRWAEIHHVGIYIGEGQVIEASSSKGRVVIQKLWGLSGGKWQVYSFARPYV